MVRSFAFV